MKLPYRQNAYIPEEKLSDYLLSESHPLGRFKAMFFQKIGFDESNINELKQALYEIAQKEEVKNMSSSSYGKKYIIDGSVETSSKRVVKLQTVWILEADQTRPRFITAYPV